jgi:hypothetical protein
MQTTIHIFLPDADALMNATECLENHQPSVLHEVIQASREEKIRVQQLLTVAKLLLGAVEVEVDAEVLEKLSDRVTVRVRFLKNSNTFKI